MRINILLALLLVFLCGCAIAQPTPPATPQNPESMGIQVPQPTSSTQAPPALESGQGLVWTTQASASAAAPPTAYATTVSTYMIVPPGTSAPNLFYIPYYPSTVASCNFGQWVPMWFDIKGYGPLYTYEWYPNGRLVSQYKANMYPSWQKMWFYGDTPGWHTLQYYCNGWSNYIYIYVYESTLPPYGNAPVYPTTPGYYTPPSYDVDYYPNYWDYYPNYWGYPTYENHYGDKDHHDMGPAPSPAPSHEDEKSGLGPTKIPGAEPNPSNTDTSKCPDGLTRKCTGDCSSYSTGTWWFHNPKDGYWYPCYRESVLIYNSMATPSS